jgi:hypothetical protein
LTHQLPSEGLDPPLLVIGAAARRTGVGARGPVLLLRGDLWGEGMMVG